MVKNLGRFYMNALFRDTKHLKIGLIVVLKSLTIQPLTYFPLSISADEVCAAKSHVPKDPPSAASCLTPAHQKWLAQALE